VHASLVAGDHLRQRGGAFINVGSALSDRAIPVQVLIALPNIDARFASWSSNASAKPVEPDGLGR
jgi:hypothetical protein